MASNVTSNVTPGFDYEAMIQIEKNEDSFMYHVRMQYLISYPIICTLGVILNTYVIITGCRIYHKVQKSPPSVWVLALAVTHLLSSGFLVMQFLYALHHFNWRYGAALCKISSFVIYASMFSTATLLSLWTISNSSCIHGLCAKCGINGISTVLVLVLSSWTFGTILSIPSLLSRELRYIKLRKECIDDYDLDDETTTADGRDYLMIVVFSRFLLGILAPLFVTIVCTMLARRQGRYEDENCKKITIAIKVAYFVCWSPLLFMALYQITKGNADFLKHGLPAATVLAAAHSCINPVIYLFLGQKNMYWMVDNTKQLNAGEIELNQRLV